MQQPVGTGISGYGNQMTSSMQYMPTSYNQSYQNQMNAQYCVGYNPNLSFGQTVNPQNPFISQNNTQNFMPFQSQNQSTYSNQLHSQFGSL